MSIPNQYRKLITDMKNAADDLVIYSKADDDVSEKSVKELKQLYSEITQTVENISERENWK